METPGNVSTTSWPAGEPNLSPSPEPIDPNRFTSTELSKAISEIGWGIKDWEILELDVENDSVTASSAKVELLEVARIIVVEVSERGWKILSVEGFESSSNFQGQAFETLDNLLSSVSPAFENRRTKLLMDSLENISTRRSWGESD